MTKEIKIHDEAGNISAEQLEKLKPKTKKSRRLPKSLRPEEFRELIKAVKPKDTDIKIAYLLASGAGMRISEVVRCSPEHFRPNSIFIPPSKYGVERIVPIPKGWKEDFLKQLPIKRSIRVLQWHFKNGIKRANLNPLYTFHSLRHFFATRSLESGIPLNQVQVLLGHSNISTTSIYVKANPLDALKSYEELF